MIILSHTNAATTIVEDENETLSRKVMPDGSISSPSIKKQGGVHRGGLSGDSSPEVSSF